MNIEFILAMDDDAMIGDGPHLPWKSCPADFKWFVKHTQNKAVVMGSITWESLPQKPLKQRLNVVLTKNPGHLTSGFHAALQGSPEEVITQVAELLKNSPEMDSHSIMVIGGFNVYRQWFPWVNRIYLTRLQKKFGGTVECPILDWMNSSSSCWSLSSFENQSVDVVLWNGSKEVIPASFLIYDKK